MNESDLKGLAAAVAENPGDVVARRIYADALEDAGAARRADDERFAADRIADLPAGAWAFSFHHMMRVRVVRWLSEVDAVVEAEGGVELPHPCPRCLLRPEVK